MVKFKSLFGKGGLSLDRLRNFALIADAGGLSLAAGGDPARMSLFSKQVKELEGFFGVALTLRQGRRVRLTQAGQELARLAHAHLSGLEDFQQTCKGVPQTLSVGSANSLIEWLVMPRMASLRRALPNTLFEFYDGRTGELVRQLVEMSLDLALVREDAVVRPLKFKRLLMLSYSLFVPKRLAGAIREDNLKVALASWPLGTSIGGQFRERLTTAAAKAGWPLRIEVSCSSFTQASQGVKAGAFAGVLPNLAAAAFAPGQILQFALPFLKSYARPICLAWNPRLTDVRPVVERAVGALRGVLGEGRGDGSG